jgi:hypothetical protein
METLGAGSKPFGCRDMAFTVEGRILGPFEM